MNLVRLSVLSLIYYWRTNTAVVLGVATAVAVLSGALLVGDSVRGSLRDLVLQRLGKIDHVVVSAGFFREQLAADLQTHAGFPALFDGICPIVVTEGFVTQQTGGERAGGVRVYGVDDRFWQFHGISSVTGPEGREALISPALARELGADPGATILVRVQRPTDVPLESLHGRRDDLGRTLRATVRAVLPREALGEFSLQPQQGEVRAVFLPLSLVQNELEQEDRVNALLVSRHAGSLDTMEPAAATAALEDLVRNASALEDFGLRLRLLEQRNMIALESDGGLIDDVRAAAALEAARELGLRPQPVFSYLANSLRIGDRNIPYSLVTAMDLAGMAPGGPSPIILTDWAAQDLRASAGDLLTMEFYVWQEPGELLTRTAEFQVAGVVPITTGDRDLAPAYPGISDSMTVGDWDPPFPIDLRRIRPIDEEYWELYRTTPKAFIPLAAGQQLWQSRHGELTSIRFSATPGTPLEAVHSDYAEHMLAAMNPIELGIAVHSARADSLEASRGATNFSEYFVYFSFFLVVSALLLAALFFKLSIEQRAREVGLLRAVGFRSEAVRLTFAVEGLLLSCAGAVIGLLAGIGYAYLMVTGLRTWWVGAVGTTALTLHISPLSVMAGALGGIVAAMACVWATVRSLASVSERRLLAGQIAADFDTGAGKVGPVLTGAIFFAGGAAALITAAAWGYIGSAGGFFGAGIAILAACLCLFLFWFGLHHRSPIDGQGWQPIPRLGLRNAMYRPARTVLSIATIASATFILISVDTFRKHENMDTTDRQSGTGGYSLLVESLFPIVHDPVSREGRAMLGLADLAEPVAIEPFRVRPGDDASCLNLYEPQNPRILAPRDSFIDAARFAFRSSLQSNEEERANPWLLLHREEPDGAVPVIADANSMDYVLHRKLGEDIVISTGSGQVRLRLVAALSDSIFQGELLMSQSNFLRLFPEHEGYRFLLVETPPEDAGAVAAAIEDALADLGADARAAAARLAEFHRVENTYLSTFQMLGGLGLLLGTAGLGAVLLRNIMERRRELAMLRALGYKQSHFFAMAIAENVFVLASGLATGTVCALLAISPVVLDRGGTLPGTFMMALLGGVLAAGLVTSLVATAAALRSPLLPALRSE